MLWAMALLTKIVPPVTSAVFIGFSFCRTSIAPNEKKITAELPAVKERRMEISVSGIDNSEIGIGCQFVYDAIEDGEDQIYNSCYNQ